ncbi:MAG TPA: hypothetical protein PLC80_03775 [Draconibacterium sp.]|nr:hypothetical protein [Draconibacterium sp.]
MKNVILISFANNSSVMENITKKCFVCQKETNNDNSELNLEVNLPVCKNCKGTQTEKEKVLELLDSLADGFVCGCI